MRWVWGIDAAHIEVLLPSPKCGASDWKASDFRSLQDRQNKAVAISWRLRSCHWTSEGSHVPGLREEIGSSRLRAYQPLHYTLLLRKFLPSWWVKHTLQPFGASKRVANSIKEMPGLFKGRRGMSKRNSSLPCSGKHSIRTTRTFKRFFLQQAIPPETSVRIRWLSNKER